MIVVGIDVGGTFTDIIIADTESGRQAIQKVPTTPREQDKAVIAGLVDILRQEGIDASDVEIVVHGTTVATNAMIQRAGAKVCLLTTRGLEDVIEIGRQNRTDIYDLSARRPEPLVPQDRRIGVEERLDYQGNVLTALGQEEIARAVERVNQISPDSVAVVFLHSFKNPAHELLVKRALEKEGRYYIAVSSEVMPEFREFERTSTTVLEAYLGPLVVEYLSRLEREVSKMCENAKVTVIQSNGGTMLAEKAHGHAISLAISGLAGGVIGGWNVARQQGFNRVITLDMGGTSCDISAIVEHIIVRPDNEIAGLPIRMPSIDVTTIGAGGGSVAWIDEQGIPHVGPQSAGAVPGPVSYALGGEQPTITDANLILGRINAHYFLGGARRLDKGLAERALREFGKQLDLTAEEAATGIIRISTSNMVEAIRDVTIERGYDPRKFSLVAFGGAGPTQITDIADTIQIPTVLIPRYPGITSAYGLLCAGLRTDLVKTVLLSEPCNVDILRETLEDLTTQAKARMIDQGASEDEVVVQWTIDMRYKGQSHELQVAVSRDSPDLLSESKQHFVETHWERFGYALENRPVEWVSARVTARVHREPIMTRGVMRDMPAEPIEMRDIILLNGDIYTAPIYRRDYLCADQKIVGPAVVEQVDSTLYIGPEWVGTQQRNGTLLLRRVGHD